MDQEASTPKGGATCRMEHCLLGAKCRTEKKLAEADVQGRQTAQRVELMPLVVLAKTIETTGSYVVRVEAQYLLTSTGGLREQSEASKGTCVVDSLSRVTRLLRKPTHSEATGHRLLHVLRHARQHHRSSLGNHLCAAKARVPSTAPISPKENETTKKE